MTTAKTELVAPAGSPQALDAAIGEGADAVYLGLKDFPAQARHTGFTYPQFEGALRSLRRMGRRLYVAVNTVFEQREADRVYQLLKYLAGLGPDAVLVQDLGIIAMAREQFPSLKLSASRRMNIASARAANLLSRYGFSRVTLARELSLEEIRSIRAATNMELEVFVHGALCVSISGLCLFSGYLGGKSDNRGLCTQACRRFYTTRTGNDMDEESGGYFFSPSDLQLIERLPDLAGAGVNSFRIEGRAKSAEYAGTVVSAYRLVMDNLNAGEEKLKKAIADAQAILKNDFARPKTTYLINGAENTRCGEDGEKAFAWLNPDKDAGPGMPWAANKRYAPVISRTQEKTGRSPGRDRAPLPPMDGGKANTTRSGSKDGTAFPAGMYVMVSRLEDTYVLQSVKPVKAILPYSRKLSKQLLSGREKALPFPPRDIILSLDPFFPQETEAHLAEDIPALVENGYAHFIVNNLGHFSLLRAAETDKKCVLIAGPWLYAFNTWAWAFASKCGAEYCVSPLENNRQNLERSFLQKGPSSDRKPGQRSQVFVTIFARPSLFRIRSNLGSVYDFKAFSGSRDEAFLLAPDSERTLVYPRQPFSIVDKTPFLLEAGFSRFILDFSSGPLKKIEYREIMEAAERAAPLPLSGRFNWKNGFFAQKKGGG